VDEEYSSSGSYGDPDSDCEDIPRPSISTALKSLEVLADLLPMFDAHLISPSLRACHPLLHSVADSEDPLTNDSASDATAALRLEPIECVIGNVAHLDQFPPPDSQYTETLLSIFV
jgi:hypothetical protein